MKLTSVHHEAASREVSAHKLDEGLRSLLESNLIGIVFTDAAGVISDADDTFLRTVGYSREDLPTRLSDLTPREHYRLDEDAFEKLVAFGSCNPFEKEFIRSDGTRVPVLFGATVNGDGISCFVIDLSQNKKAQDQLNHLAYHDALTDLPNQSLFKDRLNGPWPVGATWPNATARSDRADRKGPRPGTPFWRPG